MPAQEEGQPPVPVARRTIVFAVVIALATGWLLARPVPEIEQHRRHLVDLQREVAQATATKNARASERGRVLRLRAQARAAQGDERTALDDQAATAAASLGWTESAAVRTALLGRPLLTARLATPVSLADAAQSTTQPTRQPAPQRAQDAGCEACHLAVDTAGYEAYPQPLRTHPRLASFVGPGSPHPVDRVQCTQCHEGQSEASTFEGAKHARLMPPTEDRVARAWADPDSPDSMLPASHTEVSCAVCHAGEIYQPPAPKLSEALLTLDRAGCYGCHQVSVLERAPKRGPDLRHIRQKLSPEWVRQWIANPRRVKPAAWMPQFWRSGGSNPEDIAAIAAVTEYLFAQSPAGAPIASAVQGQADKGKTLVESTGCLGCHVVGAADRDGLSLRRSFGQVLDGLGNKTTKGWLASWVRDPVAMNPETRMPRLRLSNSESADVAAYLATLTSDAGIDLPVPNADEPYRNAVRRYNAAPANVALADASSGTDLRQLAGRVIIDALGCVNCHEIDGLDRPRTPRVPITQRRIWRDADARNIHGKSAQAARANGQGDSGVELGPDYGLGENESARLALALSVIAGPSSASTAAITGRDNRLRASGRLLVQQRNCVGCHAIEGVGGDLVDLMPEPAMGPPLLTPEGARVQADWLRRFLDEPKPIRPWLSARMPTFGLYASDIDRVGDYLRLIAPENPPVEASTPETVAAGRELFDLLKCQQCHVLNTVPADQPTANLAPDLRLAHERLQPAWIQAWLQNPTAVLPGTRMPSFWPQYPGSYYEPLNRDAPAQIRAIRDHLLTLR